MLIDDGVIVPGEADAAWHIDLDRLEATSVPSTLTGVLEARLDSLAAGPRAALQRASVVGRVFWDAAVTALEPSRAGERHHGRVARGLCARVDLSARSVVAGVAAEYIFKHALLRDVDLRDRAPPGSAAPPHARGRLAVSPHRGTAERVPGDDRRSPPARRRHPRGRRGLRRRGRAGAGVGAVSERPPAARARRRRCGTKCRSTLRSAPSSHLHKRICRRANSRRATLSQRSCWPRSWIPNSVRPPCTSPAGLQPIAATTIREVRCSPTPCRLLRRWEAPRLSRTLVGVAWSQANGGEIGQARAAAQNAPSRWRPPAAISSNKPVRV